MRLFRGPPQTLLPSHFSKLLLYPRPERSVRTDRRPSAARLLLWEESEASQAGGPDSRLDGARCVKSIVLAADTTDGQTETPAAGPLASAVLFSPVAVIPSLLGTTCDRAWLIHPPAPPTDLVTLLQHFLI